MSRKRKDGKQARGVWSKHGILQILLPTSRKDKNGKTIMSWQSTGLRNTPENVELAIMQRERLLAKQKNIIMTSLDSAATMNDLIDEYLSRNQRKLENTTYKKYSDEAKRIRSYMGSKKIKNIKIIDVESFYDWLFTEKKYSLKTAKETRNLLSRIMELAHSEGIILINPVSEAEFDKDLCFVNDNNRDASVTFFDLHECKLFLKAIKGHKYENLFHFILFYGLRRSEALGIRWQSLVYDSPNPVLTINHTITKGTKVNKSNKTKSKMSLREFPLDSEIIDIARAIKEQEEKNRVLFGSKYKYNNYVFKNADGSLIYPDSVTRAFKKIIKAHPELPQDITLHGLRTSCISLLVEKGVNLKAIQKWVGHADINTTLKYYTKIKEKEAQNDTMSQLSDLLHSTPNKDESDKYEIKKQQE